MDLSPSTSEPFSQSVLAWSAARRLVMVAAVIAALWLCVLWAVALP